MFIVPLGVIWAGYALGWYGFSMVKGPGTGFADVIFPSRVPKMSGIVKAWSSTTATPQKGNVGAGSSVGGVGTTFGVSPTNPIVPAVPGSPQAKPKGTTTP